MNVESKNTKTVFLCLLLLMALFVTACTNGGGNTDGDGVMNVTFGENGMIRNGTEYFTYQLGEGQRGIISVSITKVSGRLDIDIYRVGSNDKQDYTGRDLDSASFDVIVDKPGEYKIRFSATDFVGDYKVSWRVEDKTEK